MEEPINIYAMIQPFIQKEIDDKIKAYASYAMYKVTDIPIHIHNGVDTNQVDFIDLNGKTFYLPVNVPGTSAATSTNYGIFFIAPVPCTVSAVKEAHQTAGTDGGTVTLTIEKLTGTQALDAGIELMTPLSLKATKDTVVDGVLSNVPSNLNLNVGDRLALKDSGTLTSVAGVSLMIKINF